MVRVDAIHHILTSELLPVIRTAVADLGGDGADTLIHVRPTPVGAAWQTNSAAALLRHLCGVLTSWGAACLGGEDVTRDRDGEFGYAGPVEPELDRLGLLIARLPDWAERAVARGDLAHPTGTAFDVDAARKAGTFTVDWVLGHILHDVAAHAGHLELTRDVLLDRRET